MKKHTLAPAVLLILLAWYTGPASAVGDAEAGKAKSAVCSACHGADGKALQPTYPNLAGQHASYIAKQLTNYRDGDRVNALMSGQAANLTDQDILDLSAYFASMSPIQGVASDEDPEALKLGENIYRGGITSVAVAACTACHGPAGLGNGPAGYPTLGGQNAEYTADQMRYWREASRANDPNAIMRTLSHRLTDKEILSVSNYIAGLHGEDAGR